MPGVDEHGFGSSGRFGRKAFLAGATLGAAGVHAFAGRAASAYADTSTKALSDSSSPTGGQILAESRFPIGLFWPPPPFQTTLARYQEIVDAGFTFMLTGNYLDDAYIIGYALGFADQVGLDVLVADPDIAWLTQEFMINNAGGEFTVSEAEATAVLRRVIDRYAGHGWRIVDGALSINGGSGNGSVGLTKEGADWTDYTMAFDLTLGDTTPSIGYAQGGWALRAQDENNAYIWLLSDNKNGSPKAPGYLTKAVFVKGVPSVTLVALTVQITPSEKYKITTTVKGSTITTSINGTVVDTTTNDQFAKGRIGFREAGQEAASYDNVVVTGSDGKQLFADDFSDSLAAWTTPGGGHPSFAGLVLYDEPSGAKVADLGKLVTLMASLGEPYFPYVNLLPGQGAGYTDQAKTIGGPVVSFDRYPILPSGVDTGYFRNWADVRAAATTTGKPAWTFIQSTGYNAHAVPTKAGLLWQINVSLAYGCKGIQYFTYWTPDPARGEGFHDALIDVDGARTPLYAAAASVNADWLAPVGKELLGKPSQAINAVNLTKPPDGLAALPSDDPVITNTHGSAAYVGRFGSGADGDDHRWVLLGNYSATSPASTQLFFADAVKKVELFDPSSGSYTGTGKARNYHLDPGAAVLLRLT